MAPAVGSGHVRRSCSFALIRHIDINLTRLRTCPHFILDTFRFPYGFQRHFCLATTSAHALAIAAARVVPLPVKPFSMAWIFDLLRHHFHSIAMYVDSQANFWANHYIVTLHHHYQAARSHKWSAQMNGMCVCVYVCVHFRQHSFVQSTITSQWQHKITKQNYRAHTINSGRICCPKQEKATLDAHNA